MERKYATGLRNVAITAATSLSFLVGRAGLCGCESSSRDLNRTEKPEKVYNPTNSLYFSEKEYSILEREVSDTLDNFLKTNPNLITLEEKKYENGGYLIKRCSKDVKDVDDMPFLIPTENRGEKLKDTGFYLRLERPKGDPRDLHLEFISLNQPGRLRNREVGFVIKIKHENEGREINIALETTGRGISFIEKNQKIKKEYYSMHGEHIRISKDSTKEEIEKYLLFANQIEEKYKVK